jgi:hypothetical protein
MGKKKAATAHATPTNTPVVVATNWLICRSYNLEVRNSDTSLIFQLDVVGNDGNQYFLKVVQLNDRTGLIQRIFRIMADRWPAFDWEFQADASGSITDIR